VIDLLAELCARHQVPGAVVCTFDRSGITAMACHGVADVEGGAPMRPDTMFRIYSVAKLLTARAVVELVRAGLVDLDAPVSAYVEGLRRRRGQDQRIATTRQALSHTAGLVPDALTRSRFGRNDADLRTEIVRDYERAFSFAAPGRHFGYSNAGFNLSAVLIERLTGCPFAEAMRELLLDRAGMRRTTHDPAVAMTYPMAQHHEVVDGEVRVIHRPLVGSKWMAGSQCYATAEDMGRYGSWLLRDLGRRVSPRPDRPLADLRLDVGTRYGMGCYVTPTPGGGESVGHEGFLEGSWLKVVMDVGGDRGLVWFDNRGDELRDDRYAAIERIMPGILPRADGPPAPDGGPEAAAVAGRYRRTGGRDLEVHAEGDDLVVTHQGRRRRLCPYREALWRGPATSDDLGCWRPHAGSTHVCLGAAEPDPDGTHVVHLNALPYVRTGT
jgi:CubicO group peptidase (beta-lactamase class C family)